MKLQRLSLNYTNIVFFLFIAGLLFSMAGKYIIFLAISTLFIIYMDKPEKRGNILCLSNEMFLIVVYYIFLTILTIINAIYLKNYFYVGIKRCVYDIWTIGIIVMLLHNVNEKLFIQNLKQLFMILGIMGLAEGLVKFPIWEYIFTFNINSFVSGIINTSSYRTVIIFSHPIMNAVFWGCMWLIYIYIPYETLDKKILSNVLCFLNIMLTKSRSTMIAMAIVLIFVIINMVSKKEKTKKKHRIYCKEFSITLIILCIFIFTIYIFRNNLLNYFHIMYDRFANMLDGGTNGDIIRITNAKNSIRYFKKNTLHFLFGKGSYSSQRYLQEHPVFKWTYRWDYGIDNQFFTIIYETGIIGLIIIICVYMVQVINLIKKKEKYCTMLVLMLFFFWMTSYFYESLMMRNIFIMYITICTFTMHQRKKLVKNIKEEVK